MDDLARQLTEQEEWTWMDGMRWSSPPTYHHGELVVISGRVHILTDDLGIPPGAVPDLADPATAGCLLAMLGERRSLHLSVWPDLVKRWWVCLGTLNYHGATLGEAVARCLLALGES